MIPWLEAADPLPPVEAALRVPNGLLAASDHLDVERLIDAYRRGVFPWYGAEDPVLWWSPDPRMVLMTDAFKVSRSLRKSLRHAARDDAVALHVDRAFEQVMRACAEPRPGRESTWIGREIVAAYVELHRRGLAHSVEMWRDERLVGGLYGVSLGRMFFGESMFSREADASKIALAALVRILREQQVRMIDCQQNTRHLASLGAREISRAEFCSMLRRALAETAVPWKRYSDAVRNDLLSGY
ncbi:MAG TPA: leucyl/phenylalanyl-tRNA--protein transferase [Burkholderiaceae bacterium]|nr:leucyl/phenylalanyl-tRNA--protein transferase [Burkholderiaceae bacterium]